MRVRSTAKLARAGRGEVGPPAECKRGQHQGSRRSEGLRNDLWGGFSHPTAPGHGAASWGVATGHQLHAELLHFAQPQKCGKLLSRLAAFPGHSAQLNCTLQWMGTSMHHAQQHAASWHQTVPAAAAAEGLTELQGVTAFLAKPHFSRQQQRCSAEGPCLEAALFGPNHPGRRCRLLRAHPRGRHVSGQHRAAPAGAGEVPRQTHGEML